MTELLDAEHAESTGVVDDATFAGVRKVIFVVDASGSLVDSFPRVLDELSAAIYKLPEDEAFTVLFFGSDGVTEVPPVGLRWTSAPTKRRLIEWIAPETGNVTAWGRGDPIEALQQAVKYSPDELVLLSDNLIGRQADEEDVIELLDLIAELVGEDVQKIHVVQFFNRDPQQVLKQIAEQFNGTYSLILTKPSADSQSAVDPLAVP